jgi:hypothetical protein
MSFCADGGIRTAGIIAPGANKNDNTGVWRDQHKIWLKLTTIKLRKRGCNGCAASGTADDLSGGIWGLIGELVMCDL